jgi:hypothetical protein
MPILGPTNLGYVTSFSFVASTVCAASVGFPTAMTPSASIILIKICQLDRPKLTEYRRRMISLSRALASRQIDEAVELRLKYFGYPDNLPRLSTLRPPNGNSRLAGIADSHYERRKRGELPKLY